MSKPARATAHYTILKTADGNRYQFFCDGSGMLACTTKPVHMDEPEEECLLAWEREGRRHFNRCHRCGKWVVDAIYNADTLECADCSPWEEQPSFCPHCGVKVAANETFCHACKRRLCYGGASEAEAGAD